MEIKTSESEDTCGFDCSGQGTCTKGLCTCKKGNSGSVCQETLKDVTLGVKTSVNLQSKGSSYISLPSLNGIPIAFLIHLDSILDRILVTKSSVKLHIGARSSFGLPSEDTSLFSLTILPDPNYQSLGLFQKLEDAEIVVDTDLIVGVHNLSEDEESAIFLLEEENNVFRNLLPYIIAAGIFMIACLGCICIAYGAVRSCKMESKFLTKLEFEKYFPIYKPKNRFEKCPLCTKRLKTEESRMCYSTGAQFHGECGWTWFSQFKVKTFKKIKILALPKNWFQPNSGKNQGRLQTYHFIL